MAPKKKIHLNFFDMTCNGSHMGVGMWKNPNDNSRRKDSLEYYTWLAKLAEKGKISCIFFADMYGGDEPHKGHAEAGFRGGGGVAQMDPVVFVSAMAAVTKSVAFGITGSTSYLNPFVLSRTWSTLDHATKGRIAWNVVTSYSNSAARANGFEKVVPHDQRYERADEFMDLCYALWEGSWEDGVETWSPENGAYDFDKIHKITYKGLHHKTDAYGAAHPSPQRTPVLFQAGQSPAGKAFAAKHAEAVFVGGGVPKDTAPYVKEMRAKVAANGRNPDHLKVFPQITPILGRTLEEAEAKRDRYKALVDYKAGLAKLSGYLDVDFLALPPDEPFKMADGHKPEAAIHALINTLKRYDHLVLTPRMLGETMAFCGFGAMPVGTPEMVADVIEDWVNNADIDGFNVAYVSNPESFEDLVELLVPVLQKRGLMWDDYLVPGGTFRENLLGIPGQHFPTEGHRSEEFRYENLKKLADENGDVTIVKTREEKAVPVEKKVESLSISETTPVASQEVKAEA